MANTEEPSKISATSESEGENGEKQPASLPFTIVCIGASAGGLEAFTQLLNALSDTTGMAFVLVQHLDPEHESQLPEILSRATRMPVRQITEDMAIEPNSVYVIPPGGNIVIANKALHLTPRTPHLVNLPIDRFFESLAAEQGNRSIGIVLSGTGADGSEGLRSIKSQGGITFVQSKSSAKFGAMPLSALATGSADFELTPQQIGQQLSAISSHPYIVDPDSDIKAGTRSSSQEELRQIFLLVQRSTGVDFTHYKQPTTARRIARRMLIRQSKNQDEYLAYLKTHPEEVANLYQDLLISVTHFFRDPESFRALAKCVGERLKRGEPKGSFRVWVPGCATGEELYSLAITLQEVFQKEEIYPTLQLFGTDISELALATARAGRYAASIVEDVSTERLQQYFQEIDGRYQVVKPLRESCVFARQDFTHDPPFSRVDLISCRNTLIYFDQSLQKAALSTFQYSLNEGGLLFLGSAESIGSSADMFQTLDSKHKIYVRSAVTPATSGPYRVRRNDFERTLSEPPHLGVSSDWRKQADELIQNRYAPDGIIINQDMVILQTRGRTSYYLQSAALGTTRNLLLLAHETLLGPMREAVLSAIAKNSPVKRKGLQLEYQGEKREINLEVIPLSASSAKERYYFVVLENLNAGVPAPTESARTVPAATETAEQELFKVSQQLAALQEDMHSLRSDHEAAREEQEASNEEISSANEELQSTNEELSTAKEEVQSANEELTTVNEELQNRNKELSTLAGDLANLLDAVTTPVVMLDRQLLLRRFTPSAARQFGLQPADVGHGIGDIPRWTHIPTLKELARTVVDTLAVSTQEVQDNQGCWWSLSIRPYQTVDHRTDGAVLTFSNVNSLKMSLRAAEQSLKYANGIIETVREPLAVLSANLRIERANNAFYQTFLLKKEDTEGVVIYDLDAKQWDLEPLHRLLEEVLAGNDYLEDFELEHAFPRIGRRSLRVNVRRIAHQEGEPPRILLALEDVTLRELGESELRRSNADLEQFSYAVAHDLTEPLRNVGLCWEMLSERHAGMFTSDEAQIVSSLTEGIKRMQSMIRDLLSYSLAGGTGEDRLEAVSVEAALNSAVANLEAAIKQSGATVTHGILPSVPYNSVLLTQVFQNLLGNAIKYRREVAPQIHVTAVHKGADWVISVRDNGRGFDERYSQRVFGLFKRLDNKSSSGSGIGLAICKRVAERFGGRIWVDSEQNIGSHFHFTIPLQARSGSPVRETARSAGQQ